jgi:hypothetical protein
LAEDYSDRTLALFPERVEKLGRALGVAEHAIRVFCDAEIRAHIIFQLSKLVSHILRRIRQQLDLPTWDVLVVGRAAGRLKAVSVLDELGQDLLEPLVVLLNNAQGDEEIPEEVAGIVLGHEIPHLSHLGVRARQAKVVLVACEEPMIFEKLQVFAGQTILLTATPEKVDKLLAELWEQTFLLTDLRPPLTTGEPARYVLERLNGIPEAGEIASRLERLLTDASAWDELKAEESIAAFGNLVTQAGPDKDASRDPAVQVDMAMRVDGRLAGCGRRHAVLVTRSARGTGAGLGPARDRAGDSGHDRDHQAAGAEPAMSHSYSRYSRSFSPNKRHATMDNHTRYSASEGLSRRGLLVGSAVVGAGIAALAGATGGASAAASRSSDQQIISFYRREHRLSSSFISCQSLGLKGIWKAFFRSLRYQIIPSASANDRKGIAAQLPGRLAYFSSCISLAGAFDRLHPRRVAAADILRF